MRLQLAGAFRRAFPASTAQCLSFATSSLPEGLYEITRVPRTPSWSLAELHQEGVQLNAEDTVLTEKKVRCYSLRISLKAVMINERSLAAS